MPNNTESEESSGEGLVQSRMAVLALAERLKNVTEACRRAGISRSRFYELKRAFQNHGAAGLAPSSRPKPRMPNQTPAELEQSILNITLQFPTYSYFRISKKLRESGVNASPSTVRAIWERHDLTICEQRLRFLQRETGTLAVRHARLLRITAHERSQSKWPAGAPKPSSPRVPRP